MIVDPERTRPPEVSDLSDLLRRLRPLVRLLSVGVMRPTEELTETALPVAVDLVDFEQVLLGLVFNAKEATRDHGELTIATEPRELKDGEVLGLPQGAYAELLIIDHGCGMTEEVQARLFEQDFSTKGDHPGHGASLARIREIVHGWGGEIIAEEGEGGGTVMRLLLPLSSEPVTLHTILSEHAVAPPGLSRTPRRAAGGTRVTAAPVADPIARVLLVDDDEEFREVLRRMLEQSGFRVVAAGNAGELSRILGEYTEGIDLLLADVVIPGDGGPAIAKQVRAFFPELLVLYMSGYSEEIVRAHGVRTGGTMFLEKPFTREELIGRLGVLLSRT